MTKARTPDPERPAANDLLPEYDLDYGKARPNRFTGQVDKSPVVVVLDPDISEVFTTSESVNAVLRALITTMPPTASKTGRKARSASPRSY
jgi:hypothetical protein